MGWGGCGGSNDGGGGGGGWVMLNYCKTVSLWGGGGRVRIVVWKIFEPFHFS